MATQACHKCGAQISNKASDKFWKDMESPIDESLVNIEKLTHSQRAAIKHSKLLQPPIPCGNGYFYRQDIHTLVESLKANRHAWRWVSPRYVRIKAIAKVRALVRAYKNAQLATRLFFLMVGAAGFFVLFNLARRAIEIIANIEAGTTPDPGLVMDLFGNSSLGFGALWTATGVILSASEIKKLTQADTIPDREVVQILRAAAITASSRAWEGINLVLLGTAILMLKAVVTTH